MLIIFQLPPTVCNFLKVHDGIVWESESRGVRSTTFGMLLNYSKVPECGPQACVRADKRNPQLGGLHFVVGGPLLIAHHCSIFKLLRDFGDALPVLCGIEARSVFRRFSALDD